MIKKILCADDDLDDKELLCDGLTKIDPEVEILHAINGMVALEQLSEFKQNKELPCLMIVDLNMPLLDGKELIKRVKADSEISSIPIVVFSTSKNLTDQTYFETFGIKVFEKPHTTQGMETVAREMLALCAG